MELRRSMALILERVIAQLFSIGSHRWKRSTVHLFLNTFCTLLPVSTFSASTGSGWLCQWFGGWCGKVFMEALWRLYDGLLETIKHKTFKCEEPMLSSTQQILSNGDQSVKAQRRVWPRGSWCIFLQNLMQWKRWKHDMAICWDMMRAGVVLLEGLGGLESAGERSGEAQEHPSTWSATYLDSTGSPCCLHFREQLFFLSWERCCNSGIYNALHLSSCPWRSLTSFSEFVEGALFFAGRTVSAVVHQRTVACTDAFGMRWCTLSLCCAVRASGRECPYAPDFQLLPNYTP